MNKKKKIILASILGILISFLLINYDSSFVTKPSSSKTLAVYIQDDNSETGYSKNESTNFPTDGYVLNLEKSTCTNGGELSQDSNTKKISLSVGYKSKCSLYFDKEIKLDSSTTLAKLGKTVKEDVPNFAEAATTDETVDGLYATEDDYGTSYYYRGATTNNYVKFANFYWRIIRINGDGSLRIIYDGTSVHANGTNNTNRLAITNHKYNAHNFDAKYVGYMYGPSGTGASTSKSLAQTNTADSDIKKAIEAWYKTNISEKGYDAFVSDNIFCNDRTTPGKEKTGWSSDTSLGYGKNATGYGALSRIMTGNNSTSLSGKDNLELKFKCENKNDAFTKEDMDKGNGKLEQKVGMITADEIVAAGSGKYGASNSQYYLYKGNSYFSLSPYSMLNNDANVFYVSNTGGISGLYAYYSSGAAPVINLSVEYVSTMSGNGSMESPYEVK